MADRHEENGKQTQLDLIAAHLVRIEANLTGRFDRIEADFTGRFDRIDGRLDILETGMASVEPRLSHIETRIEDTEPRTAALEKRVTVLEG